MQSTDVILGCNLACANVTATLLGIIELSTCPRLLCSSFYISCCCLFDVVLFSSNVSFVCFFVVNLYYLQRLIHFVFVVYRFLLHID